MRLLSDADRETGEWKWSRNSPGVGPTSSSGTGTSATATAMIGVYGAGSPLDVVAPGGAQIVEWAGEGENLFLTGPATLICRGEAW